MTENERIFKLQRSLTRSNPTIDIKERRNALLKLKQVIKDKQIEIEQALFSDLHKSKEESYLTEIGIVLSEINFA